METMRKFLIFLSLVVLFVSYLIYKACDIPDATIEGWVAEGFEELRFAYKELFNRKLEKGSSFAAFYEGRLVAHLWAGCKDFFCSDLWQEDTVTLIHSTTKSVGALALAVMADRGHLNYSERVSTYWPEFAVNGKADVTVDQFVSHSAGVVGVEPPLTFQELREGSAVSQRLAEQVPAWPPGTQAHYHGLTIGLYMDELFRRVDPEKRRIVEFFEREIVSPLNLDFKIGLNDPNQQRRFAVPHSSHLRLMAAAIFGNNTAPRKVFKAFFLHENETFRKIMSPIAGTYIGHDFFRDDYLSLPLLSSNGIASVHSVAHIMGLLALGGRKSRQHLPFPQQLIRSPEVMQLLNERMFDVSWMNDIRNVSFGRGITIVDSPVGTKMLGSPGMGGQMGFADSEKGIGWAYLTNHLSPFNVGDDPRHLHLQDALYRIVGRLSS